MLSGMVLRLKKQSKMFLFPKFYIYHRCAWKFQLYKQSFISIDSKNTGKGRVILAMKKSLRMTEGSISQKIIFFAIPLFLGKLFQQL